MADKRALRDRITRAPLPFDRERADAVLAASAPVLGTAAVGELIRGAAGSSPYLARLIARHGLWLADSITCAPETVLDELLTQMAQDLETTTASGPARRILRETKARAALLIALADLGGVWSLAEVTQALTKLADAAVSEATFWLLALELRAGRLPGLDETALESGAGFIILAMGKMGAHELNFSSDIDLIALFDDTIFADADLLEARARCIHVTRQLVRMLSENTEDGYVFRTDLRLRPSPSTTPVCLSVAAAERYYEAEGRTWERAAHIKARALIDRRAGAAYLRDLQPFIWRRHLDFAAIDDAHSMLDRIRAQKARFTAGALPGHDIKLGPGGIREIEFFAQTRQLIMGGRDESLRVPTTLGALDALVRAGQVGKETRDTLAADYRSLREIEHRLQMIEDAQTHLIPKAREARLRVAMLSGQDLPAFERRITELLARVHAICEPFFTTGAERPSIRFATLIDEENLTDSGFERPSDAARLISRWHDGEIPATRAKRARTLFRQIEPQIVERLSRASSPDQALVHFDHFLSGLPAGVQLFSLFQANPNLLDLIIEICAAAPQLGQHLGRHPQTLDALLDQDFWEELPGEAALADDLGQILSGEDSYERVLDAARRWAREQWFRISVQVLRALIGEREAGAGFSRIAETFIAGLYPHVVTEFARRHGAPPGRGMVVLAMGRLGSREMTAGSDLDLITIYDGDGVEASSGPRPLPPSTYYPRLTQALMAALTAPTAEGSLYEVDMRLRPSGRQGPVAVSLPAFEHYQIEKAWVWEHMALSRARIVAGNADLAPSVDCSIERALMSRKGQGEQILAEAAAMRVRIIQANRSARENPWSLKHAAGGLMEIEFLVQTGLLISGLGRCNTQAALPSLANAGWLSSTEAHDLAEALEFLQSLQQVERVALSGTLASARMDTELQEILTRASGCADFGLLETRLCDHQNRAASIAARIFDINAARPPDDPGTA